MQPVNIVDQNAAIPEIVGANFHHGQGRRQGTAGHHMLWPDFLIAVVEIHKVASHHIDRTHCVAQIRIRI